MKVYHIEYQGNHTGLWFPLCNSSIIMREMPGRYCSGTLKMMREVTRSVKRTNAHLRFRIVEGECPNMAGMKTDGGKLIPLNVYECRRCKTTFSAMAIEDAVLATGRHIRCPDCGDLAYFKSRMVANDNTNEVIK